MGLPKFTAYDGSGGYIWAEYPSLPSDQADLATPLHRAQMNITHKRSGVVFAKKIVATRYIWNLFFQNVTRAMVTSLIGFSSEAFWRFYPDSDLGDYFTVYLVDEEIKPELQRGGSWNFQLTIAQK